MRALKAILYFILLLVIIALLGILCLVLFLDPNKMKPELIAQVKNKTGYQLAIDGNLHWSFFPRLSIKADHMTLSQNINTTPFLDVHDIKFAISPSMLWKHKKSIKGQIDIGILMVQNIRAQNVLAKLKRENDVFNVTVKKMNLYNGNAHGQLVSEHPETTPHWRWQFHFEQIDLGALFQDVARNNNKMKLAGSLNLNFQGTTDGKDKATLLNQAKASGDFKIMNGAVQGTDINYFITMADAFLNGQNQAVINSKRTLFQSLTGTFAIQDGILTNNDLLMVANAFKCTGKGTVDLKQEQVTFNLQVNPFNKLNKLSIPLVIQGSLRSPKVKLDLLSLKEMATQLQIHQIEKQVTQQLKELPEKADKYLRKLLGG